MKRLENRLRQRDLAKKIGVSIHRLKALELDRKQSTVTEREALAQAFGLPGGTVPNS